MNFIIIHYKPLVIRRQYYETSQFFLNSNVTFLTSDDREELDWCFTSNFFTRQKTAWSAEVQSILPIILFNSGLATSINQIDYTQPSVIPQWAQPRNLKESEISLIYKHHSALLLASLSNEPTIIIEDDALLNPDTGLRISSVFEEFKLSDLDYLDLAGGCNLPLQSNETADSSGITYLTVPRSRTTAGYLISPSAALKLASALFPLSLPLDWSFQSVFLRQRFNVAWCIPELLRHGSEGTYPSSIQ
jgi:hypothetical protein